MDLRMCEVPCLKHHQAGSFSAYLQLGLLIVYVLLSTCSNICPKTEQPESNLKTFENGRTSFSVKQE